jgi:hypothetical protein
MKDILVGKFNHFLRQVPPDFLVDDSDGSIARELW